jgi:hypothetical protein
MVTILAFFDNRTFNCLHTHCFSFMHSAYHLELPPIHLVTDEVMLSVEYSTLSYVEPRQRQCKLLNVMNFSHFFAHVLYGKRCHSQNQVRFWQKIAKMVFGCMECPKVHMTLNVVISRDCCETGCDTNLTIGVTGAKLPSRSWPDRQ